ncbi:MAG: TIGR03086 family metal-binding protein [Patescibacteria group bacterium]
MDPKAYFNEVLPLAGGCMQHISDAQLSGSTPCSEWDLKALINHMIGELMWLPELLGGKTIAQVGNMLDGDLVGSNIVKSWDNATTVAKDAVEKVNLGMEVGLSYGKVSAGHYIKEITSDLLIHGWDVAQSIKCSLLIPNNLAQIAYDFYEPQEDKLKSSGLFGKKITVGNAASLQTKLLAVVGRTSI